MGRDNRVWYRKDTGWWMVTIAGKKTRLIEGPNDRKTEKLAERKFAELSALAARAPEAPSSRVCDVVEAFLKWSKENRSDETNRNYVWHGQSFCEHSGHVKVSELMPAHVTRWATGKGWNQTTERNARRSIYRAFAWAAE